MLVAFKAEGEPLGNPGTCKDIIMPIKWRQYYNEVRNFIMKNPEIIIKDNILITPERSRNKLYDLLYNMRAAFIEEILTCELKEVSSLSEAYKKIKAEVIKKLELDYVSTSVPSLDRFLEDPKSQLTREIFDLSLDLLMGNIKIEEYYRLASQCINEALSRFYQIGYQKWFELSLVKLLNPKKVFHILLRKPRPTEYMKYVPSYKEPLPSPQLAKFLLLGDITTFPTLISPDYILYSEDINRYVAFKSQLRPALWFAAQHSEEREWLFINSIKEKVYPKPDLLIYLDKNIENLVLVADAERICKPDVMVLFAKGNDLIGEINKAILYQKSQRV